MSRLFYVKVDGVWESPPQPVEGMVSRTLSDFAFQFRKHCPYTTPIEASEFPELYQGRRRTGYADAVKVLEHTPVQKKHAEVNTFTKAEKINFTLKSDPNPRIIQPRTREYNVSIGVFLKTAETMYVKTVSKIFGSRTIVKGLNSQEVGRLAKEKWDRFDNPVAIGMDAKAFDQHVNVDLLAFEHSLYVGSQARFSDRCRLAELLSWQLHNRCRTFVDGKKVVYAVEGRRMSGDMNTGIGNCIIMCAAVWSYCKSAGITKYELLNNGDDCVLFIERSQLGKVSNVTPWFKDLGLNMVVEEPVYVLEEVEFCQSNFILTGSDYRQIRKPSVVVCKDSVSLKPFYKEREFRAWLAAMGEGGLALNSGVPVLQEFYAAYMREARGAKALSHDDPTMVTGTIMLSKGMEAKWAPVTPEARYSFWLATKVTPDEQMALEDHYRQIKLEYALPKDEFAVLSLL